MSPALKKALEQKARLREAAAQMSFVEKYNRLVAMQRRSAEILAARGLTRRVWPEWPVEVREDGSPS